MVLEIGINIIGDSNAALSKAVRATPSLGQCAGKTRYCIAPTIVHGLVTIDEVATVSLTRRNQGIPNVLLESDCARFLIYVDFELLLNDFFAIGYF